MALFANQGPPSGYGTLAPRWGKPPAPGSGRGTPGDAETALGLAIRRAAPIRGGSAERSGQAGRSRRGLARAREGFERTEPGFARATLVTLGMWDRGREMGSPKMVAGLP
jgi:hypothetical protein